jgi:hypothetical protein
LQELETKVQDALDARIWAMEHRFGGSSGGRDYSEEEVAEVLLAAEKTITASHTKRRALAASEADEAALRQLAPAAFQSGHPHEKYIAEALRANPELGAIAAKSGHSPKRLALALGLGLAQLSAPPATRPATQQPQQPKKAPPVPAARTAPRAPAKDLHRKQAGKLNEQIVNGKRGAVERFIAATLR